MDKRLKKASSKLKTLREDLPRLNREVDSLNLEGNGGPEAVFKKQYETMLRYNARLIRRLNTQLDGSLTSRDIYALSTLMSQQREVIADLRSISDLSGQVELLQRHVMGPLIGETAQHLTDLYYQLRRLLAEVSEKKHTQFALNQVDELVRQVGLGLKKTHSDATQKIAEIMLGPVEKPKAKRKKV